VINVGAKVAIYTVGSWPGQVEKIVDRLTALNVYVGKFSGEERLLQAAEKGLITHLLITQEGALNAATLSKMKTMKVEVLNFKDAGRII